MHCSRRPFFPGTPPLACTACTCRSLTDLFAADPECAGKSKAGPTGGLARSLAFAGAGAGR